MSSFAFRLRFQRSPRGAVDIGEARWETTLGEGLPTLVIAAADGETAIRAAERLVLRSEGWPSEEEATRAAESCFRAVALVFARLRVGADYGERAPKGAFTLDGLAWLEQKRGCRVLNDDHGLMVFMTEPAPEFVRADVAAVRVVARDRFEEHLRAAIQVAPVLAARERLALVLFNSSLFQDAADSRFLLLMMAVESMLSPSPRSEVAAAHVEALIVATRDAAGLGEHDRRSLIGSLAWLRRNSISQTGRDLANERLGEQQYSGMRPGAFFTHCYGLRSRLVHGLASFPSRDEVDSAAAQLEVFVADLLTAEYLGFEE